METATSTDAPPEGSPWPAIFARFEAIRRRLFLSAGLFVVATGGFWLLREPIFDLIARPIHLALAERGEEPRLVFTRLTDPFIVYLSVSMIGGLAITVPVVAAQAWSAFHPDGRRLRSLAVALAATLLFVAGVLFGHQILLPYVVRYLLELGGDLRQMVKAREYLRFAWRLLVALGFSAQLPLACYTLSRAGLVTARRLLRWFPYATLAAFTLAALITPPDGVSQIIVAVPILFLYLLGVAVAAVVRPRKP